MENNEDFKEVTEDFIVDQYDKVYDEERFFYCKWNQLSDKEKEIIKKNPFSAK